MNHAHFELFLLIISKIVLADCQERISILENIINKVPSNNESVTQQIVVKINDLICPSKESFQMILPIPCSKNFECKVFGNALLCCDNKCVSGIKIQSKLQLQRPMEKILRSVQLPQKRISKLACPPRIEIKSHSNSLFSIDCSNVEDCTFLGIDVLCCEKKCAKGIMDLNEVSSSAVTNPEDKKVLVCPFAQDFRQQALSIFSIPCEKDSECKFLRKDVLCCNKKCINGVAHVRTDIAHLPRFFGLIDAICPEETISEVLDVKLCQSDLNCGGRICCPDKNGKNYCRTPTHRFGKIPGSKQFEQPIRNLVSFMQCTKPPPPLIDIFPKTCKNNFDCFPNLCCQENGNKHCRPPKKSILAAVVTRLGTSPLAKSFIARITT